MGRAQGMLAGLILVSVSAGNAQVGRYYDYSGTITWRSRFDVSTNYLKSFTADSVVVTVVKDKATCSGTWIHNRIRPNPLVEPGTISGPGLLEIVVHFDHVTPSSGTYQIIVGCPTPATAADPSNPKGGQISIRGHELPSIPDLGVLSGSDTMPHEQTDSINGVTGTFIITWNLTTTSKPDATQRGKEVRRQRGKEARSQELGARRVQ